MLMRFLAFEETSILFSGTAVLTRMLTSSSLLCAHKHFLVFAFLMGWGDFSLWVYLHFLLTSDAVNFLKFFWPLEHLFGEISLQVLHDWGYKILVCHPGADICQFSFFTQLNIFLVFDIFCFSRKMILFGLQHVVRVDFFRMKCQWHLYFQGPCSCSWFIIFVFLIPPWRSEFSSVL